MAIDLTISDVDPVANPDDHHVALRSVRQLCAAAEVAGPGAQLQVRAALHPAHTGWVSNLLLWPMIQVWSWRTATRLNAMPRAAQDAWLREAPGVDRLLVRRCAGIPKPGCC